MQESEHEFTAWTPAEKRQALVDMTAARGGVIEVEDIVEEASDPKHIFHDEFNWDDASAAHERRLEQAHDLIHRYKVIFEKKEPTGDPVQHRLNMFSKSDTGSGYSLTTEILATPERAENLLNRLKGEAGNLNDKINTYRDVAGIIAAGDKWSVVSRAITEALK
tara:strand:- start:197 stop:688 length:492 start_codon:yes stop_codon:yes gene_type:complete